MRKYNYNLTNVILRWCRNKGYYFDESGIYRSIPMDEVDEKIKINLFNINGYEKWDKNCNYTVIFGNLNQRSLEKIIVELEEGDSIEKFYQQLENVKTNKIIRRPQGVERFITKIGRPIFKKDPENYVKNSFDFIMIEVNIVTQWEQDRMQYIKENKNEIINMVVSKLKNNRTLKKYGITTNFLKLSKITVRTKYNYIEFIFELKDF